MNGIHTRVRDDESGVALLYAILVAIVIGGLVTVIVARTLTETRASDFEEEYEDAFHVAEAGAEVYLQQVAEDASINSGLTGPAEGSTAEQQRAWAVAQADAADPGDLVSIGDPVNGGEAIALRPDTNFSNFIYAVGYKPNRAAFLAGQQNATQRVIAFQLGAVGGPFSGNFAVLTEGPLRFDGSALEISGTLGAAHTNSQLTISGSGVEIQKGVSYSADDGTPKNAPICDVDAEPCLEKTARETLPEVAAENLYDKYGSLTPWYEFCAGTWRVKADTVCDGAAVTGAAATNLAGWWDVKNPTMTFTGTGSNVDAVFYIADSGGRRVILGDLVGGETFTIVTTGDLEITSNKVGGTNSKGEDIVVSPKIPGILVAADGDISMNGNDKLVSDPEGFVAAGGSLSFGGTPFSEGVAWLATDEIDSSKINGTGNIIYNGGANADFGDDPKLVLIAVRELR